MRRAADRHFADARVDVAEKIIAIARDGYLLVRPQHHDRPADFPQIGRQVAADGRGIEQDAACCRRALRERASRQMQHASGVGRQQFHETRQTDEPAVHEPVEAQRHRGLEPHDPERRPIELEGLLIRMMRRVVGGDHVNRPVNEPLDHRIAVGDLAKRRVHLEVRVVAALVRD